VMYYSLILKSESDFNDGQSRALILLDLF